MGRRLSSAVLLLVALPVLAAPASARTTSGGHAQRVRASLRKQIRKNPNVIRSRSFLRKAGLVDFKLPVTIRIRQPCPAGSGGSASCPSGAVRGTALNERANPTAQVDLGPSLGQRTVALGGSLAGEVEFSDTYDGGALGNVSIKLLPSTKKFISTSSVPILWNPDASDPATRSDANWIAATEQAGGGLTPTPSGLQQGCGDFLTNPPGNTPAVPPAAGSAYSALMYGFQPVPPIAPYGPGEGLPGYPYYDPAGPGTTTTPAGYLPVYPGVDALDRLVSSNVVGNNDELGPVQTPFPYPAIAPGAFTQPPDVRSTVFRTNALQLAIAAPGTQVDQSTGTGVNGQPLLSNGPQGSQNIIVGASGGQANLFGNIPGKAYGIDVTVSFSTVINAIARIMDQDAFHLPLLSGEHYPADVFACHQVWLGAVQNYIPGIRLQGDLRISPAITKDGKLRIAVASVQSSPTDVAHIALSACVFPFQAYLAYNFVAGSLGFSTNAVAAPIPPFTAGGNPPQFTPGGLWPVHSDALPIFYDTEKYPAPANPVFGSGQPPLAGINNSKCNTAPWPLVQFAADPPNLVSSLAPASLANGYTTSVDGSQVTVAGDINVNPVKVDVLIGDA